MKTIKNLLLFLFAGTLLVSCDKATYKKSKGGMPYQLFKGNDTQQIKNGNFIKIQFTQKINDSVYFTTVGSFPQYKQVDSSQVTPYDISELWTSLKVGDSVVATQMMDTFIKRDPTRVPPQFKRGDKIMTFVKILAIFKSDSAARIDYEKTNKDWMEGETKTIQKYLDDKKIITQKTPSGVFVEMITPGTGNLIDSGKYISAKYLGYTLAGKKFDGNIDSTFGHTDPLSFIVGTGAMIKGFDDGVKMMRLGSKAKIYIPSILAWGGNPSSPIIKPYENVIFEIEIVDIKDKAPMAKQEQMPPPPPPSQK